MVLVYCPSNLVINETKLFSFNFAQEVFGPIHTLDLIFTLGVKGSGYSNFCSQVNKFSSESQSANYVVPRNCVHKDSPPQ